MRNICTGTRNFTTSTCLVPKECSANRQIAPVGGALLSIQFARSSRRVGQLFVGTLHRRTLLFCAVVLFPERERVVLRVLADDEVAHLRHCRLGHTDLAA